MMVPRSRLIWHDLKLLKSCLRMSSQDMATTLEGLSGAVRCARRYGRIIPASSPGWFPLSDAGPNWSISRNVGILSRRRDADPYLGRFRQADRHAQTIMDSYRKRFGIFGSEYPVETLIGQAGIDNH